MVRTEAIYPVTTHQQPSIIDKPILNKPIGFATTRLTAMAVAPAGVVVLLRHGL